MYYAVVSTVAKPFHGNTALYVMRISTVVWSTLLLTGALWALMTFARSRWPRVGLLLATTPTLLYSTAVAAPNGVHLAAAICLRCSMTALLRRPAREPGTRGLPALGALVATAGVTTLFTHALGVFWVPLILAGAWGLSGCPLLRRLFSREVFPWLAIIGVGYLAAGIWVLLARTNDPLAQPVAILDPTPWWYVRRGPVLWPLQAIAAFPDKEDGAPVLVYAVWFVGVLICVSAALGLLRLRMRRAEAVTIALVTIGSLAVPTVLTLMTAHRLGGSWQGRYGSPLTVGFILGLAMLIDQSPEFRQRAQAALLGLARLLFVVANVVSAVHVLRTTSAMPSLVRVSAWHVPPGWLLVALGCASVAGLTAALRRQPQASHR
jgi:hypothetical protein